jgi:predicted RecA/RadA family phage recombinase
MRNFIQPGNVVTVIAPTGGVTSGQLVIIKAIVGVASTTQPAGAQVEIATVGEFDLAKNAPDTFAVGDVAKVAAGSNIIATAGTLGIGWVMQAAAAGATTVRVRLVPSVASPPTLLATETAAAYGR